MFDIKENLKKLPDTPGVYIHKDKIGNVIYVGKALSIKNRVRQYFGSLKNMPAKVRVMVEQIEEFEYITTRTEGEALILEATLIKKHMPKYNVLLRDDKTYPFIKLTFKEDFPRIIKTRRLEKDGSKYFGPYTDVGAVNVIIDLINDVFSLKRCSSTKFKESAVQCLNYHIKKCRGMCVDHIDKGEYINDIAKVEAFLGGKVKILTDFLKEQMIKASEDMDYEKAAEYRDYIVAAESVAEKQRVEKPGVNDMDIVVPLSTERHNYCVIFFVRQGKLSGRENFLMEGAEDKKEAISEFFKQYYSDNPNIPPEIAVERLPEECELTEEYLSNVSGRKVKITVPQRGSKRDLLSIAQRDALELLNSIEDRARAKDERRSAINNMLEDVIKKIEPSFECLGKPSYENDNGVKSKQQAKDIVVEAYDISNLNGVYSVGAMVVFHGIQAHKKSYRRFKIRTIEGPDDYGSLQEVIYRRLKKYKEQDKAFDNLPHIIFLDGGKGQLSAVEKIMAAMGMNIPLCGMVKDDKHKSKSLIYRKYGEEGYSEMQLKEHPMLYKYIGTLQEEVHRFAVEYHRTLRGKATLTSALDEIPGVGEKRRNALLSHFGSIEKIKNASTEELASVGGITEMVAQNIKEHFKTSVKA